jgi:hypothetical protein
VGRLEVIGGECLIGCVGGVITLVSCPCLSVEFERAVCSCIQNHEDDNEKHNN